MRRILLILLVAYITGCNTKETFVVKGDLAGCLSSYQEGSVISDISLKNIDGSDFTEKHRLSLEPDGKYMIKGRVPEPVALILEVGVTVPGGNGTTRLRFIAESGTISLDFGSNPYGTSLNEIVFKEIDNIKSHNDSETILRLIEGSSSLTKSILQDTEKGLRSRLALEQNVEKTSPGKMYTDFKGTYGDSVIRLSDYVCKGKYVIVDFWASWCGPCREKIPELIALYNSYINKGVEVVGISVRDKPENTLKMIERLGIPYPQIFDTSGEGAKAYGISTIPEIIIISPEGTILVRGNDIDIEYYLRGI